MGRPFNKRNLVTQVMLVNKLRPADVGAGAGAGFIVAKRQ